MEAWTQKPTGCSKSSFSHYIGLNARNGKLSGPPAIATGPSIKRFVVANDDDNILKVVATALRQVASIGVVISPYNERRQVYQRNDRVQGAGRKQGWAPKHSKQKPDHPPTGLSSGLPEWYDRTAQYPKTIPKKIADLLKLAMSDLEFVAWQFEDSSLMIPHPIKARRPSGGLYVGR